MCMHVALCTQATGDLPYCITALNSSILSVNALFGNHKPWRETAGDR